MTTVDGQQQQCRAKSERNRSLDVELDIVSTRSLRQQLPCKNRGNQHQWCLDDKDHLPTNGLHEWSTHDNTKHRSAGGGEAPQSERSHPFVRLEQSIDVGHGCWSGGSTGNSRQQPEQHHRHRVPGEHSRPGKDAREQQTKHVHALVSVEIADLSVGGANHAKGEHRPGDRPVEHGDRGVQVLGDRLQRHHENRDRRAGGEQTRQHHDQRCPLACQTHLAGDAPGNHQRPGHDRDFVHSYLFKSDRFSSVGLERMLSVLCVVASVSVHGGSLRQYCLAPPARMFVAL